MALVIVSTFLLMAGRARPAHANVNNFVIQSFHGDYTLSNDDKQGRLHVQERLSVDFSDYNHGIFRSIPETYKGQNLHPHVTSVTDIAGHPWKFTSSTSNSNLVLKIGDPAHVISGSQTYVITYDLRNVMSFYNDHDELYWDINGDAWQQPFNNVTATFQLPEGLVAQPGKLACYTGSFASTTQDCNVALNSQILIVKNNKSLGPQETLTVLAGFDKGVFKPATRLDWLRENLEPVLGIGLPPLLVGTWAFSRWRRLGRDFKGRGTIIAQYEPPDKLSPAHVGALIDYKLDNRDISATIIDLAVRKYLRIIEENKKMIFKDQKIYSFELLNSDYTALEPHEVKIMKGLFASSQQGETTSLTSLKNSFYTIVGKVKDDVTAELIAGDYFPSDPAKAPRTLLVVSFLLVCAAIAIRRWVSIGLVLSALISSGFALLMPRRSAKGVAAKEHIEGLKLYMNTAEKDRINMLQSPTAPYAEKSAAPKKSVELFEKLLPYAIVLQVEKGWAEQFKDIYSRAPDWYSGNWSTFNAIYLANSLSSGVSAMGTNFSAPGSAGGSGFSGGGFSGGGGGGGGGGGW
ncbi:MAG: hypothetical protein JWS12_399 [Candidatus Saccharibacteria bacterium]|nr:hypothetical protein [Candidatus Saccharibacteria bacterium]